MILHRSQECTLQIALLHADESICCAGCLWRRTEITLPLSREKSWRGNVSQRHMQGAERAAAWGPDGPGHLLAKMRPSRNESWQMAGWGGPSSPWALALPAAQSLWETKKWSSSVLGRHCSCHGQNGSIIQQLSAKAECRHVCNSVV